MEKELEKIESQQEPKENQEWRWCLVGNIVKEHPYGEEHIIRAGTKHFRPGAKVYCAPGNWGDSTIIAVIGCPRYRKKYIEIVMKRELIENFRIQKCFKPSILEIMNRNNYAWWGSTDEDRDTIEKYYLKN